MGQVAYSIAQAAAATATTEATITEAIRDDQLVATAAGAMVIIGHTALKQWVKSLPRYNT